MARDHVQGRHHGEALHGCGLVYTSPCVHEAAPRRGPGRMGAPVSSVDLAAHLRKSLGFPGFISSVSTCAWRWGPICAGVRRRGPARVCAQGLTRILKRASEHLRVTTRVWSPDIHGFLWRKHKQQWNSPFRSTYIHINIFIHVTMRKWITSQTNDQGKNNDQYTPHNLYRKKIQGIKYLFSVKELKQNQSSILSKSSIAIEARQESKPKQTQRRHQKLSLQIQLRLLLSSMKIIAN